MVEGDVQAPDQGMEFFLPSRLEWSVEAVLGGTELVDGAEVYLAQLGGLVARVMILLHDVSVLSSFELYSISNALPNASSWAGFACVRSGTTPVLFVLRRASLSLT